MSSTFSSGANSEGGAVCPALVQELSRLDQLVDWEKRLRSVEGPPRGAGATGGNGGSMRQSVAPARDLLDRLGAPDRRLRCVLIAGTKAKGSVASLVGSALRGVGIAEAIYASPHVERVEERIRIRGEEIPSEELARALSAALDAREAALGEGSPGAEATWFDVMTAAGLQAMAIARVDWALLECGLGGRLDSTNAVEPVLGVLTQVELEHTAILGDTRARIAWEKAGIARSGVPLVSAVGAGIERADFGKTGEHAEVVEHGDAVERGDAGPTDEAAAEVDRVARDVGARLVPVSFAPGVSMAERNETLAAAVLDELGSLEGGPLEGARALDPEAVRNARLPGRSELFRVGDTPVVLDGAHVPASLELLLRDLSSVAELAGPPLVVFGTGREKDASGLLKVLIGRVDRVLCTAPGIGPYLSPDEIARLARGLGLAAKSWPDPDQALEKALKTAANGRWILVTGSLHLVGRLRSRFTTEQRLTT